MARFWQAPEPPDVAAQRAKLGQALGLHSTVCGCSPWGHGIRMARHPPRVVLRDEDDSGVGAVAPPPGGPRRLRHLGGDANERRCA